MLHGSLRDILRGPIRASSKLSLVTATRRHCLCTAAVRQTYLAGQSDLSGRRHHQQRWCSSATTVADVKQMQADVAALVAHRHWDDAFDAAVECSRAIKDLTGTRHPGYASALNNLALIQKNRGELDAAALLYEEALDVYKLVYGEVHPSCAMAMHNTCLLYKSQGKHESALKLCKEALDVRRKIYHGDEHADVAVSMYTLGAILVDAQSYSRAETLLRDSVALLDKLSSPGNSGSTSGDATGQASPSQNASAQLLLATAKNNLALCLKSKGSYEEAEELYREVLSNRANVLGPEHQDTMTSMHNLAELYRAVGDEEAAHKVQEELMRAVSAHRARHSK